MDSSIIVACISAVASVVTALIAHYARRETATLRAAVQNGHQTNIRDDIDRVLHGIDQLAEGQERLEAGQRRHDAEIAGLREELRIERRERIALAERVDRG